MSLTSTEKELIAKSIVNRYKIHYDNEIAGCASLIAYEVAKKIGGIMTAGYISYGAGNKRNHIWVEDKNTIHDPMKDVMFDKKDYPQHNKIHQDQRLLGEIISMYDMYYVPDPHICLKTEEPLQTCLSHTVDKAVHREFLPVTSAAKLIDGSCADFYTVMFIYPLAIRLVIRELGKIVGIAEWNIENSRFDEKLDVKPENKYREEAKKAINSYMLTSYILQD